MIFHSITSILMLSLLFSVVSSRETSTNFRNRRMPRPIAQSGLSGGANEGSFQTKRNLPFVIRVPYSKIVPSNALFSHSVSWKTKLAPPSSPPPPVAAKSADESTASASSSTVSQTLADVQVSQFHSQDTNGQVVFGFNAPDQMRIEQRNADGTVHGTYSYLDPYGQVIKRQYWDTGAGFHVTSDSYPFGDVPVNGENPQLKASPASAQYTPEVQAARDLHFQLYQQALASFLPSAISLRNDRRRNGSAPTESDNSSSQPHDSPSPGTVIVTPSAAATDDVDSPSPSPSTNTTTATAITPARASIIAWADDDENVADANQGSINIVEPDTENGSIVIQKPEYLRISWTTESKKYRRNPVAAASASNRNHNRGNDNRMEKSTTTTASSADNFNATESTIPSTE